ncbi:uncharacterized protein LOC113273183 [Papaver somniferum]|uniref:uncharacterized protein LOC113273183 n=1 Tax=Papaver somniferum TaxID=3469 RepID=UPI000E70065A|nr:uncharacterized protein LOC113273183 [Papaver somniferum]
MGKGKRQKIPSSRLKGFVTHTVRENSPPSTQPIQSSSSGTPYPLTYYISCDHFSAMHRKYLAAITAGNEPKSFKEAMNHPGWKKAMDEEIRALEEQGIWELEELPPAVAAVKNWEVRQMDVHNAFLHGDFEEEVYMKIPLGFAKGNSNLGRMQLNVLVYVDDLIVEEFPMETNHQLALAKGNILADVEKYRRLVGRLIYLSVTRPDLAYSVHILSQFMQQPRMEHWEAAFHVVRYLKKCPGQGILLRSDSGLSLKYGVIQNGQAFH